MSRVTCAPPATLAYDLCNETNKYLHDPSRSTSKGTGESQHLDTGIALECGVGDDTVFDGVGGTSTNRYGTEHLEYCTEDHGLTVGEGSGGHTSSPSVCDII